MRLIKWEPLETRLFNIFDDPFFRSFSESDAPVRNWHPAVDIYEDEKEVVLKAELPELDPKNIKINIEEDTLSIEGERKVENEEKKDNYRRIERSYGAFHRNFYLPENIDKDSVKATYKNGVLKLSLKKKDEPEKKKINIPIH